MTDSERMSVQTFATELGELIRRYLLTFDPAAPTELQSINLAVTGANLGLNYTEQGGQPPSLHISLSRMERDSELAPIEYPMENPPEDDPRRHIPGFKR
jgi:hypothetical protein